MKFLKFGAIAVVVIIIGALTAPYWGGCKIVYQTCKWSCDLEYLGQSGFKADMNRAACKTGCAGDRIKCDSK